ncbi:hypothetical protein DX980_00330 (plasmid) [Burkholderia gladioli]|uniref:hypothetical protein n=1 Tax=Burkholderia gladioli TaxID=28095 RepID=UPI001364D14A|nr:hypothetical protein [Burkholderia gladioli]KAF1065563.1 hypothetical protein LvStA_00055 [Burkholderia gladioli]WAG17944.1 hypothetical protein DX980_00330 [Burkholderia gladioli]
MKNRIFGRKNGSDKDMVLLAESVEDPAGERPIDPGELEETAVALARRAVQVLRKRAFEGYVLFEGDPTVYAFTPETDFVYPPVRH